MNTMKNSEQGGRSEIKINRKMRMWNKYKNYCIVGGGIVAVVLVLVLIVNLLPGSKNNTSAQDDGSNSYVAKESTTADDSQSQPATENQSQAEKNTETPTEPITEAPVQSTTSTPEKQTFTTKDQFAKSVFVGDTIVNGISYYKFLDATQVVSNTNMVSEQVAGYADEVAVSSPDKVFIMIGLNDANYGTRTTDQIVNNIQKAVTSIKAKNSSATVYVLSVMPITKQFEDSSYVKQSFLNELNYKLSTDAASFGAVYIDVATAFKDSTGYMYSDCTSNGYSLKLDYYPYLLNRIAGSL